MQDDPLVHRLKFRDLRILLAVTQSGSMAKAAAQIGITQPAISRAIAEMEAMLGVSLLDRSPKGVEPTPYGRALLKRGAVVFNELSQGLKEIQSIADPTAGEVLIGTTTAPAVGIVAAVIERLSRQHPRISFHVVTGEAATLYRNLRERSYDLVITRRVAPDGEDDLNSEILFYDQLVVVAGVKSAWAHRRKVTLSELANEPWTMVPPETLLAIDMVGAFRAAGVEVPRATVATSSVHLRCTLLGSGRFLTMLSGSHLQLPAEQPEIKVLPIDLPKTRQPTVITTLNGRTLSPVAQLFIEHAREVGKLMADCGAPRGTRAGQRSAPGEGHRRPK